MPTLSMNRGGNKQLNIMAGGITANLINPSHIICFSCDQIFANRICLEEHTCSSVSFICSCGTEFKKYEDMQEHSTTHNPGHQALDHETIRKRRIEKHIEEEEKLKRLQKGEVVWKAPQVQCVPSGSLSTKTRLQVPNTSAQVHQRSQVPLSSSQISQVPGLFPSSSQAPLLPAAAAPKTDMQNVFSDVGAPTVDLWTLYQPVVLLKTERMFNKKKPYTCGKCGQCFMAKSSLISHHSSHVTDKVSGCIGCGMLLSSKKMVPRFHVCNMPNNSTKFRLITAKPLNYKPPSEASGDKRQSILIPQAAASNKLTIANSKGSQVRQFASPQLSNPKLKTYSKSNQGLNVTPTLLFQNKNVNASKPFIGGSFLTKSQKPYPTLSNRSILGRTAAPSVQIKLPTNSTHMFSLPSQSTAGGFTCRVCHIPFETPQLLQRHKCIKAQEFMAQHVRVGKQPYKQRRVMSMSPGVMQMNGGTRLVPPPGSMKTPIRAASLDNGQGRLNINGKMEADGDDDCYIVESGPDKPAEMIYQVTSSVPIKT
ncbi:zinc finger protein 629-like [Salarias fasciatus]|uniref:zinc finger protein 629-like n=1 Tax=Salarias fasciatus TaxID=181472 RepID=UPI00117705F2|nr:zinc finger protein 629-like [Salarias fasciatus]